jgi:hypothetical protein
MRDTLKAYLRIIPSASAEMMAQELGLPHREKCRKRCTRWTTTGT